MKVQRMMVAALALTCCATAHAALVNRYSFNEASGSVVGDSVGGQNGTVVDPGAATAVWGGGKLNVSANTGQGSNGVTEDAYVNFPNNLIKNAVTSGVGAVTIEIWSQVETNRNWAALFSSGTSEGGEDASPSGNNTDYIQLIPQNGQNQRIRVTSHHGGSAEGFVDFGTAQSTTQNTHLVAVFDQSGGLPGTVTTYVDGALIGSAPIATGLVLSTYTENNVWLGRSQWPDSIFDGSYDELRIHNSALSAGAVATSFQLGPNVVPEPATFAMAALGGLALAAVRRRTAR